MKVKDLIKQLEKLDGEKTIGKENEESDCMFEKEIEICINLYDDKKFDYSIY